MQKPEPINLTKTLPEPTKATRIIQAALRAFCHTEAETFDATIDGMLIRVTPDSWIVCEQPLAAPHTANAEKPNV